MSGNIRPATIDDCPVIASLIRELAVYEKLEHHVRATPEILREHLFGASPHAEALIAEWDETPVGFALYFQNYSTFQAKPGIYLEDLFVRPEARGKGLGKALLARLAKIAVERDYGRFDWVVLDWNAPSIAFYRSLGARPMDDWTVYRIDGQAMADLAATDR